MSTKSFLLRFYSIILVGLVAALLMGKGIYWGLFELIKTDDPNDTWFPNFGEALLSLAIGTLVGLAIYLYGTYLAAKRLLGDRYSGFNYLRIAIVPLPSLVLAFFAIYYFFLGPYLGALAPALLVAALVCPVGPKRYRIGAVGALLAAFVALYFIQCAQWESDYREEQEAILAEWTGPLVLTDGNSGQFMPADWTVVAIQAPYSNDSWTSAELFNRRINPDASEDNAVIKMYNTPISDSPCSYETSCTFFGQTKFGPVYKIDYTSGYALDVEGGRLEVDVPEDRLIDVVNSLNVVDATTYGNALKDFE